MDHALETFKRTMEVEMLSVIEYGVAQHTLVGDVFVARSAQGIVAVDMGVQEDDFVARLKESFSGAVQRSEDLASTLRRFEAYLKGGSHAKGAARARGHLRRDCGRDRKTKGRQSGWPGPGAQPGSDPDPMPPGRGGGWRAVRILGRGRARDQGPIAAVGGGDVGGGAGDSIKLNVTAAEHPHALYPPRGNPTSLTSIRAERWL